MINFDATIAKRLDISVKQNQTFNAIITILDDQGSPFNLSDSIVKISIRQNNCCCDNGCNEFDGFDIITSQDLIPTITGDGFNELEFFDTIRLSPGIYKYDMLAQFQSGLKIYLLTGTFKVKKSYTKI